MRSARAKKRKRRAPAVDHAARIARLEALVGNIKASLEVLAGRLRPIGEDVKRAGYELGRLVDGAAVQPPTLLEAARRSLAAPPDFSRLLARAATDTLRKAYRMPAKRRRRRGKR